MIGIGVDVVELERFRRTLERTPTFGRRVFTADEVDYAERRRDPIERYAVRFAAKEAVLKAMGVGLWSCPLTDIEVVRADSGAPSIALHGAAATLARERGIGAWHLTLTHTERSAQAIAVAFGVNGSTGPVAGIRHRLVASDVVATTTFYEDALGFVTVAAQADLSAELVLGPLSLLIAASAGSGARAVPDDDDRTGPPRVPDAARPGTEALIELEVIDVGAMRRRAARHTPVDDQPDGAFAVTDPDGVRVLVSPFRERITP